MSLKAAVIGGMNFDVVGVSEKTLLMRDSNIGKIRFSAKASPCRVTIRDGVLHARFEQPQRAATPGQSAVFYDGDGRILCGGFLKR